MLHGLLDSKIDFLLVGAYALAAYGYPRSTGDIDLWVRADAVTGPKVYEVIRLFGAPMHGLTIPDLCKPGLVFQIGVAPVRIDILTEISGVTFEEAWPNRTFVRWDGLEVPVIHRKDLIRNKKATGRLRDLADVEVLERDDND